MEKTVGQCPLDLIGNMQAGLTNEKERKKGRQHAKKARKEMFSIMTRGSFLFYTTLLPLPFL
eukprot:47770-Pelagomonas_calceolata.AAC.1